MTYIGVSFRGDGFPLLEVEREAWAKFTLPGAARWMAEKCAEYREVQGVLSRKRAAIKAAIPEIADEGKMRDAAQRAGITVEELSRALLCLRGFDERGEPEKPRPVCPMPEKKRRRP